MYRTHTGPSTTGLHDLSDTRTEPRWRRILPAALCAAALGASLAGPAVAAADSSEDFEACVAMYAGSPGQQLADILEACCAKYGAWDDSKPVSDACVIPPSQPDNQVRQLRPELTAGLPTVTVAEPMPQWDVEPVGPVRPVGP